MNSKQITKILSREAWSNVAIHENHEPIVTVQEQYGIVYGDRFDDFYKGNSHDIRKTVAAMLTVAAADLFSRGFILVFVEGVRALEKQQMHWDTKIAELSRIHRDWDGARVEREVGLLVARPAPLANHNCGGAVDVALALLDGTLVDMGSNAQDLQEKKRVEMFSPEITKVQAENRKILREAMERAGFVWYPGEWWHYCFGDRMWAVYTNRTECMYGPIQHI